MRIITLNVNGIRSAHRKGFFDWMLNQEADLVCLQEIKAKPRIWGQTKIKAVLPNNRYGTLGS
jgi:exonuclease III